MLDSYLQEEVVALNKYKRSSHSLTHSLTHHPFIFFPSKNFQPMKMSEPSGILTIQWATSVHVSGHKLLLIRLFSGKRAGTFIVPSNNY